MQNYGVFMEALRRSAPVPICFEKLAENMDGYFSVDKQRIVLREGMSEVQTVCAAVHEIAHSKLHNKDEIGEKYQEVELFGKPALFSNGRIDRDKLPEGLYVYDLRGSDYDPGLPVTIQEHVVVNHAATVITAAPIELPEQGFLYLGEDGLNFTGGEQTVKEFWHAQYPEKAKLSRAAEEIQAESISFAVCAYYGIETGENSFGYCRDISVKVRTQLEVKRKSGQYIGAFAVYGYLKDETDKNRLVADEYAADVVRDIFKWKLEGMSPQDIAARLNHSGVLSPMEYKKSLGMRFATSFKANPQAAWSANAVLRILKNPVYTGILIQGKETTPSYKVRKRVTKPETEWAVVPDTHEAIIERRDFDSVQKALSLDTRRSPGDSAVQLFSGMVFCGECGASMVRKTVPSGNKKYVYYVCAAHKQDKSCSPHRMRDEALEQLVLDTVKQYVRDVVDLDDILAMTDTAPLRTAEAQKVQRQLDKKRSEHERLQKLLMSLYESLADGIIDRDEYARLKQNYAGRCAECEKQMDALQETLTQIREHGGEHREWMAQFRKHLNITELERSIVVALIDRILIYRDNRVEVRFRFADEFAWQTDILRRSQIREVV